MSSNNWIIFGHKDDSKKASDLVKTNRIEPSEVKRDNLLICSLTVLRFSLSIKLWGEHLICPAQLSKALHS